MWCSLWCCLAFISSVGARSVSDNVAKSLLLRDVGAKEDFIADDLSSIKKLAAVGDSYSAGIGAGERLGGIDADTIKPIPLVFEDDRLGDKSGRTFQFHSCSGALIKDVIDKQIPRLDSGQQVLLLSASGNDAELVNVLNQCIFQWGVLNEMQVTVGKLAQLRREAWAAAIDFDKLGRGCDGQLRVSRTIAESGDFSKSLDAVISEANGIIYYTGYAKFFDPRLSPDCDNVSWTTWIYKAWNSFQNKERLTSAHRREMNELVDLVNVKLEAAVKRAGPQVEFVNYDDYVGRYHGRYCESGVDESSDESQTRKQLMFYKLNSWDPFGASPWKRTSPGSPNGTFEGDQNMLARVTLYLDPDAKLVQAHRVEQDKPKLSNAQVQDVKAEAFELPNFLPDGYGRVFHPQILLHKMIANLILFRMTNRRVQQHGFGKAAEVLERPGVCPFKQFTPSPVCNPQDFSVIPDNVFSSEKNKVYEDFCNGWVKESNSSMTVDAAGKNKLHRRTPPPNPKTWNEYNFFLDYTVSDAAKACSIDCKEAFARLGTYCSNTGAQGIPMAKEGRLDGRCGVFGYRIAKEGADKPAEPPGVPRDFMERTCHDKDKWGGHPDIFESDVKVRSHDFCQIVTQNLISKTGFTFLALPARQTALTFKVRWKDGCVLQNGQMEDRVPDSEACENIVFNNYKRCLNGGIGGFTQNGCIIYEFRPGTL